MSQAFGALRGFWGRSTKSFGSVVLQAQERAQVSNSPSFHRLPLRRVRPVGLVTSVAWLARDYLAVPVRC